jgi:hypothetical protein
MYIDLVWENVDLNARIAIIPETTNDDQVVVPLNDVADESTRHFSSTRRLLASRKKRGRQNPNCKSSLVSASITASWDHELPVA